jgi:hypothetical protein
VTGSNYIPFITGTIALCNAQGWQPSNLTADCARWMQIGTTVNVSGQISATVNNGYAGNFVAIRIDIPVASSFISRCNAAGTAVSNCNIVDELNNPVDRALYGRVYASPNNGYVVLEFEQFYADQRNVEMSYHFTYTVV